MIRVRFKLSNNQISGFSISGHASYAESGNDIVCASVSSAAFMAANTVTEVIKAKASASVSDALLVFELKEENKAAFDVLKGLQLHLSEIAKQYPEHIKVIYGGVKNA